jgi:ribosomal protein S18 acetylase RimI-like enzyme
MSHVRQATADDIPGLVRLRELLFSELAPDFGPRPSGDDWRHACAAVLKEQLAADDMRIVLVDNRSDGSRDVPAVSGKTLAPIDVDPAKSGNHLVASGDGLVACGIGVIEQRLPSPYNRAGRVGYIFGIVTDRAHRGRGHARAVMRDLLAWFDERGIERVDLHASDEGIPLYRSLGFTEHPEPTLTRRPPTPPTSPNPNTADTADTPNPQYRRHSQRP